MFNFENYSIGFIVFTVTNKFIEFYINCLGLRYLDGTYSDYECAFVGMMYV